VVWWPIKCVYQSMALDHDKDSFPCFFSLVPLTIIQATHRSRVVVPIPRNHLTQPSSTCRMCDNAPDTPFCSPQDGDQLQIGETVESKLPHHRCIP
jgi:hypothetical protein